MYIMDPLIASTTIINIVQYKIKIVIFQYLSTKKHFKHLKYFSRIKN